MLNHVDVPLLCPACNYPTGRLLDGYYQITNNVVEILQSTVTTVEEYERLRTFLTGVRAGLEWNEIEALAAEAAPDLLPLLQRLKPLLMENAKVLWIPLLIAILGASVGTLENHLLSRDAPVPQVKVIEIPVAPTEVPQGQGKSGAADAGQQIQSSAVSPGAADVPTQEKP